MVGQSRRAQDASSERDGDAHADRGARGHVRVTRGYDTFPRPRFATTAAVRAPRRPYRNFSREHSGNDTDVLDHARAHLRAGSACTDPRRRRRGGEDEGLHMLGVPWDRRQQPQSPVAASRGTACGVPREADEGVSGRTAQGSRHGPDGDGAERYRHRRSLGLLCEPEAQAVGTRTAAGRLPSNPEPTGCADALPGSSDSEPFHDADTVVVECTPNADTVLRIGRNVRIER